MPEQFTHRAICQLHERASLQNWLPFQPTLSDRLDLLTDQGLLGAGLIVVMPDCFTAYGGSQYLNSSAVGNYDDYLVQELVPYNLSHPGRGQAWNLWQIQWRIRRAARGHAAS